MKKRLLALLLAGAMTFGLAACGNTDQGSAESPSGTTPAGTETGGEETKTVKVGLICIGDENDQGYTYNFIRGKEAVTEALAAKGITVDWEVKYNVGEDSSCEEANIELAEAGCDLIINNSFGFEPYMLKVAPDYPEIEFISCTNQASAVDELENTHNAFANIYEGRYLAGVVAGMKMQEMIDNGEITADQAVIGYVGAYSFAEVISGFTAYYLGAKSVCPSVTMKVQFVGSWSDATLEGNAAQALCDAGCVMISQHSDNTTPATAAQNAGAFHTGYNNDMIAVAPEASLIGTRIDWSVYFEYAIEAVANGESFEQDWCHGMDEGAVVMTPLNEEIAAAGTADKLAEVEEQLRSGALQVFDTSTFTVEGAELTTCMALDTDGDFVADSEEAVFDGAFHESYFQSAPYFTVQIDGIEWLNSAY
ncbi:BMP family ABC transporter substrate-binding protein [Pseudoflavonifractor phocaeensis]|uniref:BMP family ABC transporter substrate-binding protein n=1 Tax=Pseudoflavonifractor phocaeensis TaxID=1870988 RepID=UPI00195B935C|nr:BMP family ABC transporter substrate-binding protein [Pseudoflavonifractor phocaeensis]MBM6722106.1 BMP family ABC transporter substrate-binding protein [Pseudoflavonifractor phocaeensis]